MNASLNTLWIRHLIAQALHMHNIVDGVSYWNSSVGSTSIDASLFLQLVVCMYCAANINDRM